MIDIKEIIIKANDKGIPIPLIRVNKEPSITATLLWASGTITIVACFEGVSAKLGGINFSNALAFFSVCFGGYLGRRIKISKDGKTTMEEKK